MAGSEDPVKNLRAVVQGITAAETVEVVEEFKVEEVPSLTSAKKKADDSQVAAADASSDGKAEATDVKAPEIKWVELSLEHISWILAQKGEEGPVAEIMATDEAWKEEFFAFQEWVGNTFDKNGRVMVPEGFNRPNQALIDEAWEKGLRELELIDGCPPFSSREEGNAVAMPSN